MEENEEKNKTVISDSVRNNVTASDKSKSTKEDTIIVDKERRRLDVDSLLFYNKDDKAVQGINYLLSLDTKCIDKEFIVRSFNDKAGNIVDENIALEILEQVFRESAEYINHNDEFLYIDIGSRKVDPIKSQEKAMENHGFTHQKSKIDEELDRMLERVMDKDENGEKQKNVFLSYENIQKKINDINRALKESGLDMDNIDIGNIEEMKVTKEVVGEELFNKFEKAKKEISQYDKKVMALFDFQRKLDKAKGTSKFEEVSTEFIKFIESNPDLDREYIDETGQIKQDLREQGFKDLDNYNENIIKAVVIHQIQDLIENKDKYTDPEQRKIAIMTLLAGAKIDDIKDVVFEQLKEWVPEFTTGEELNTIENRQALEKILELKNVKLFEEGFDLLVNTAREEILQNVNLEKLLQKNNDKISDSEIFDIMNRAYQELNVEQAVLDYKDSSEEKYFRNSKIEFSSKDTESFQYVYKKSTILTWIDDKKEALELRYKSLLYTKEELEKSNLSPKFIEKKLEEINKEIQKFENGNPEIKKKNFLDKDGKLNEPSRKSAEQFIELRRISKLTEDFIEDEKNINSIEDYNNLSDKSKEKYLRNTVLALIQKDVYGKLSNNSIKNTMEKFAQRRLEIISDKNTKFLNTDNEFEIDENIVLQEYNKVSKQKFKTYDELVEYCGITKLEYANEKLKLCEDLGENDFQKIRGQRIGDAEKIRLIDESKLANRNQANYYGNLGAILKGNAKLEEIDNLVLDPILKKKILDIDENISSYDPIVMEFLRLESKVNLGNEEMKKNAILERDAFITNHREYADMFFDCLDKDGNDVASRKFYEFSTYSKSIIAKNSLLAIGKINSLSEENLNYLVNNESLRKEYLLTFIAALDGTLEDNHKEIFQAIQKLCKTNLKYGIEEYSTDVDKLTELIGEELGIENCDYEKMMQLMFSSADIIVKNESSRRLDDDKSIDFESLNAALDVDAVSQIVQNIQSVEVSSDFERNMEKKYFENSKMEYSEEDARNFEETYYRALSESWIDNKEDAEKYYYTSLLLRLEKYEEKNPNGQGKTIKNSIRSFENKHPNFKKEDFIENGKVKKEVKIKYEKYENMKHIGDLLGDYVLDETKVEKLEDYQKLSDYDKVKYLKSTLYGLMEKNNGNDAVYKMAVRRMEVISNSRKNFIKQNGDKYEVNEKMFFKEYDKYTHISKHDTIKNFDNLVEIHMRRRMQHVETRLREYCDLPEEKIINIEAKDHKTRAIQIELLRKRNNLKRTLKSMGANGKSSEKNQESRSSDSTTERKDSKHDSQKENSNLAPKNENEPRGIEVSEIKIENHQEKRHNNKAQEINEEIVENSNNTSKGEKSTFLDKVKGMLSNLSKSRNENAEENNKDTAEEENELLPVEQNTSLFGNITKKIKSFFNKENANTNTTKENIANQDMPKQDHPEELNDFNRRIRCDGNIEQALKITQENSEKKNKSAGLENEAVQSDDERVEM